MGPSLIPPKQGLLELVRSTCADTAARAALVAIDRERIREYALSFPPAPPPFPEHDRDWHFLGGERETVAYFLTLDTVNFGSGWFPWLKKRAPRSGYFTMASHLADRFRRDGPIFASELAALSAGEVTALFGQQEAGPQVRELMELFTQALHDLGELLLSRYRGDFMSLVEDAKGSAECLAEIMTVMPMFRDVQAHHGLPVHFYKRAQIVSQDLALAFGGRGPGTFRDLDSLTIFADNLVPHVLRVDGILLYEASLAEAIDAGEMLQAGSEGEVELRACAVHAVELMAQALREAGRPIAPRVMDFMLWSRGQDPFYKARPRHRAKSVFY